MSHPPPLDALVYVYVCVRVCACVDVCVDACGLWVTGVGFVVLGGAGGG